MTEFAANAVAWSAAGEGGTFAVTVTVAVASGWARVEVTDPGPAARPGAPHHGWGLELVAAVTDQQGTRAGPGLARTAWAQATWPDSGAGRAPAALSADKTERHPRDQRRNDRP